MKKSFVTVLSLTVLTLGAFAQAPSPAPAPEQPNQLERREHMQRGGGMGERRPGGMENREAGLDRMMGALARNPEFAKKLNLTPEQLDLIKGMMAEQNKKMMEQQSILQTNAMKQTELLMAEPLDEAAIMKAVEETGKARTEMAKAQIQNLIGFRKVLTDDQRKQLREMVLQMKQQPPPMKMGEGRDNRGQKGMRENLPPAPTPDAPPPPAPAAPAPAPAQ